MSDEPPQATSILGPAVLSGVVMLFTHAAAAALLTGMVGTVAPGTRGVGGLPTAVVWLLAVGIAVGAVQPILRRVERPAAVGVLAALVFAGAYAGVAVVFVEGPAGTPGLVARLASMVVLGALGAVLARSRPRTDGRAG